MTDEEFTQKLEAAKGAVLAKFPKFTEQDTDIVLETSPDMVYDLRPNEARQKLLDLGRAGSSVSAMLTAYSPLPQEGVAHSFRGE